jgi:hypothetical protein
MVLAELEEGADKAELKTIRNLEPLKEVIRWTIFSQYSVPIVQ